MIILSHSTFRYLYLTRSHFFFFCLSLQRDSICDVHTLIVHLHDKSAHLLLYHIVHIRINYIKAISNETVSFPMCSFDVHTVGNKFSLDLENLQVKFNQKTTNANEIYKNFHCHKLVTASICIFHFITFIYISAHTHTAAHTHTQTNIQT